MREANIQAEEYRRKLKYVGMERENERGGRQTDMKDRGGREMSSRQQRGKNFTRVWMKRASTERKAGLNK